MQRYEFVFRRQPGGRYPRLWLAKDRNVVCFANKATKGRNIPGWCTVVRYEHVENGKWSSYEYALDLEDGVRPIYLLSGLHTPWGYEFSTWRDVVEGLRLPLEAVRVIVSEEYPSLAERLDAVEAFAKEQEKHGRGTEVVKIRFGHPTCRQMQEGYWESPQTSTTSDGRAVVVRPGERGWSDAIAVAPEGAKAVGGYHIPGMHGGCWKIFVCVPAA